MMCCGTPQMPISASKKISPNTMALGYICVMKLLSSLSTCLPSATDGGNCEQVPPTAKMTTTLPHTVNISSAMIYGIKHAITAWIYLLLQDITTSPVKYYTDYWKYFKYSRNWTPPGCCLILHTCRATSTDCCTAHVANEEITTFLLCCPMCQTTPTANNLPEVLSRLASKGVAPETETTTSVLPCPYYIHNVKVIRHTRSML